MVFDGGTWFVGLVHVGPVAVVAEACRRVLAKRLGLGDPKGLAFSELAEGSVELAGAGRLVAAEQLRGGPVIEEAEVLGLGACQGFSIVKRWDASLDLRDLGGDELAKLGAGLVDPRLNPSLTVGVGVGSWRPDGQPQGRPDS